MNERIEKLVTAAFPGTSLGVLMMYSPELEKFAELIVQECCDVLYNNELGGYQANYVLKEHFGAEE